MGHLGGASQHTPGDGDEVGQVQVLQQMAETVSSKHRDDLPVTPDAPDVPVDVHYSEHSVSVGSNGCV